MKLLTLRIIRFVAYTLLSTFLIVPGLAQAPLDPRAALDNSITEKILECLHRSQEAVLFQKTLTCAPYGDGIGLLKNAMPTLADVEKACNSSDDWRALPANIVKTIARADKLKTSIDPYGIRVLGAIVCK